VAVTFSIQELLLTFITGSISSSSLTQRALVSAPLHMEKTTPCISLRKQHNKTRILAPVTFHHTGNTPKTSATGSQRGILHSLKKATSPNS